MPQQLIYTSAPRGIVAGRSGYCTVARSAAMREALMLQLEKFSYYQHLSLAGGRERPIFTCRIVDIRGTRFHVLSRVQDAGLDFTGRTNFIAHHLVFTPEELRQVPSPPVILRDWPGWLASWTKEPQLLENENWTDLSILNAAVAIPAQTWSQVTGDAANGYGLLEARAGASFRVDDQNDETVLALFAESLALLEIRDPRRDCRAAAWNYTFTTSMQEQDNPADFRWRCLHSDNPAASRFATPDCRPLSAVRALKCTHEEAAFARNGRLAPRFLVEPQDLQVAEGEPARFTAKAEGVPNPAYQWFLVDRAEKRQPLAGETGPELVVTNPTLGVSRYVVRASNDTGDVPSRVATLSVEQRANAVQPRLGGGLRATKSAIHQKSEEDIERQRQKIAAQKETEDSQSRWRKKILLSVTVLVSFLTIALIVSACWFGWMKYKKPATIPPIPKTAQESSQESSHTAVSNHPIETSFSVPTNAPSEANHASGPLLLAQDSIPLSSPWTAESIGWSAKPPPPRYDQGKFFLTARTGDILLGHTNDDFFFANRSWSNSVEFIARFSMTGKIGKSRCGIMLRGSDRDDDAYAFIGCSESSVLWIQRAASGVPSTQASYVTPNQPLYLRLVHENTNFSGDFSSDGKNWLPLCVNGQIDINGSNYLLGFALCAGLDEKAIHPDFDSVTINGLKQ